MRIIQNQTIVLITIAMTGIFLCLPAQADQQPGILSCDMVENYKDLISAHPGSLKCVLNKNKATIGEITLNKGRCEPTRTISIPQKAGEMLFMEFTCELTEAEIEIDGSKYLYNFPRNNSAQASNGWDPTKKIINAITNMGVGR